MPSQSVRYNDIVTSIRGNKEEGGGGGSLSLCKTAICRTYRDGHFAYDILRHGPSQLGGKLLQTSGHELHENPHLILNAGGREERRERENRREREHEGERTGGRIKRREDRKKMRGDGRRGQEEEERRGEHMKREVEGRK